MPTSFLESATDPPSVGQFHSANRPKSSKIGSGRRYLVLSKVMTTRTEDHYNYVRKKLNKKHEDQFTAVVLPVLKSLTNWYFVSMISFISLSSSTEMGEGRTLPGGGGHCLDIGESLGTWEGWCTSAFYCIHLLICTFSSHTRHQQHTLYYHCPNWVPLWPVLNLSHSLGTLLPKTSLSAWPTYYGLG